MIVPLIFFTFASNIIYPYVFPSLPAFALLFSEIWNRSSTVLKSGQWILGFSLVSGVLFLVVTLVFQILPEQVAKTQKPIIIAWLNQHPAAGSHLIYWDYRPENSAQFYSAGQAKSTKDVGGLCQLLSNKLINYVVINSKDVSEIPSDLFSKFIVVNQVIFKNNLMLLVRSPVLRC